MDENTILKAENLTKVYKTRGQPDVTAVNHVSFEVKKGQVVGLVGESGSGKTTVARMISCLETVTDGKIELCGEDITHRTKNLREVCRHLQMVFQMPVSSFDPRRTLGSGVAESLRNRGMSRSESRKAAGDLLEMCGLPREFAARYPFEVSGGECQRAAIARAIAIRPELLICDEATSALDVTVQRQVIGLLSDLKKKLNMSYLFICHDLALVQEFCDYVLVMYRGNIVERGTPEEIIDHPKDPYTQSLLDSVLS